MRFQIKFLSVMALLITVIAAGAVTASAQRVSHRDPLGSLKRAITEANAPALTAEQETQLNALIANYRGALPTEEDEALEAAQTAYEAAILAGDSATAQAQALIIAARQAELAAAKLQSAALFKISVLASLKSGGQFDPLIAKFGNERVLGLVSSLVGRGFGGGGHRGL